MTLVLVLDVPNVDVEYFRSCAHGRHVRGIYNQSNLSCIFPIIGHHVKRRANFPSLQPPILTMPYWFEAAL